MIDAYSSTNSPCCHAILVCFGGVPAFLAGGENFRAHIAAPFGPFVVLLRKDGANEADPRLAPSIASRDTVDTAKGRQLRKGRAGPGRRGQALPMQPTVQPSA